MKPVSPELLKDILKVEVLETRISMSLKRSIKVATSRGDEFRTGETSESWTLAYSSGPMTPELARAVALYHSPELLKKLWFDLVVLGLATPKEAKERHEYATRQYSLALGVKLDDQGRDQPNVPGTGDANSSSGQESTAGASISPREDAGVQTETGPGGGPTSEGEPGKGDGSEVNP